MAVDATEIYRRYVNEDNLDPRVVEDGRLFPRRVQFHRTVDESKSLNHLPGPRVIISSSGMLAGGRVLRSLPNARDRHHHVSSSAPYPGGYAVGMEIISP